LSVSCNTKETQQTLTVENKAVIAENAININTATVAELEKLPNVGAKLAEKIVEHREKYGNFRKPEHLLLVQGISDERFRRMRNLIKTE
jgi:competence protein ComEA